MAADPLTRAGERLALAVSSLMVSEPRTAKAMRLLRTLAGDLAERDPVSALYGLPTIIADLNQLTSTRPGAARGAAKLTQDPAKMLLPGVAEAVKQLERAVAILRKAWPEGSDV